MKQHRLKDEVALQTYFIEQVCSYLKEQNKKIIGWLEIIEGKLDNSTFVMNWCNDAKAIYPISADVVAGLLHILYWTDPKPADLPNGLRLHISDGCEEWVY